MSSATTDASRWWTLIGAVLTSANALVLYQLVRFDRQHEALMARVSQAETVIGASVPRLTHLEEESASCTASLRLLRENFVELQAKLPVSFPPPDTKDMLHDLDARLRALERGR